MSIKGSRRLLLRAWVKRCQDQVLMWNLILQIQLGYQMMLPCCQTLVHDGRSVQKLDLTKSKASVLTSGITTVGSFFFFLGVRFRDSLLVQFHCRLGSSGAKEEVDDIDGNVPLTKYK